MATTTEQQTNGSPGSADSIVVENPATGEVVATLAAATEAQLKEMAERGRRAQPAWEALGFEGRAKVLRRMQKWVLDNDERFIDTLVSETGKTREDAVLAELGYAANSFGFWAKNAAKYLADEKIKTATPFLLGRKVIVRYAPVGLVGVIGPWNYPFTNTVGDAVPALAAGNSVIVKPSSVTPLTSLLIEEGLRESGIPDDVFQVLVGRGPIGMPLIDLVDFVMFTGSTETGIKVAERAAKTLTPVSLELGGKDPMIVLADADLERAANAAVFWSMQNTGQTCISVERVYVEEPIYDQFTSLVADRARALRQGVPGEFGSVDVGSFINPPQIDIVEEHVNDAVKKGARVLAGGHRGTEQGRVLRAHRARRRQPRHGVHARGDLRSHAPDHEGGRLGGGDSARERLALRPPGLGVHEGHRQGRGGGAADRGRRGRGQRLQRKLHRARGSDGRVEDLGVGRAPRPRRDPQVQQAPDDPAHPLRDEEGPLLLPVQGGDEQAAAAFAEAHIRSRQSRLTERGQGK